MNYFVLYDNGERRRITRESAKQTLNLQRGVDLFNDLREEAKLVGKAVRCVPGLTQSILCEGRRLKRCLRRARRRV